MAPLRPRNCSIRVPTDHTKHSSVASLDAKVLTKKSSYRLKKLESAKPTPRRKSARLSQQATPVVPSSPVVSSEASSSHTFSTTYHQRLRRPAYKEPSDDALRAVGFESMIKEDRSIVRKMNDHVVFQFNYLRGLYNFKCEVTPDKVPESVVLDYSPSEIFPSVPPTHMLAIRSAQFTPGVAKVTLYPAHSSVLALYCASLPVFPPQLPVDQSLSDQKKIRLPIWQLVLPSPETFPDLLVYLYSKNFNMLFNICLPTPPPLHDRSSLQSFIRQLGQTYSEDILTMHMQTTLGLWKNVFALGIFDMALWFSIDLSWSILRAAIVIAQQEKAAKRDAQWTPALVSVPA